MVFPLVLEHWVTPEDWLVPKYFGYLQNLTAMDHLNSYGTTRAPLVVLQLENRFHMPTGCHGDASHGAPTKLPGLSKAR